MQLLRFTSLFVLCMPLLAQAQAPSPEIFKDLQFRTIGPAVMSGRIVDLAVVEKDPYIFYVASATGGLWKTTNNGVTFEPVFEREGTHSIGDVVVHQKADSIVWVGTGERANRQSSSWGDGVYKSMDGGATWANMGLEDSHHIGRIVMHPEDPSIVFVAAMGHLWGPNEERGLYKTTDGGLSWNRTLYVDAETGVVDVAMDPSDPSILYAATYQRQRRAYGFHGGGPGSGLYKSTDGGETWIELTDGLPFGPKGRIGISIYRSDPSIVYASVEQGYQYNASTRYGERRAGVYRSEDKGKTWALQSDWNPRPMYASQILVDPSDDQRIYMVNSFSYSDDGGKTFTVPRQSLHGDDRIVWVNPTDSRHVIKGDDGGLGISYDRAKTWLYVTSLPVSQFYRVSVDMRDPYWVYGGLQDNGSWAGPNATYRNRGILNEDWIKTGGGDGFVNLVHPTDENTLFNESQYLGLGRLDLKTKRRRSIRPDDPKGRIGPRRNWDAWGPGTPEPELGNAMAPANWDGPFIISAHDPHTIYAGTNILWKSTDGGDGWTALGDLTTGVNRRNLPIMGEIPNDTTLSLDDGIPYYPTLTVVAESPLRPGLLYVGTDDGNLQVSQDDGQSWTEVSERLPGLPESSWISAIEVSRFAEGTVYVAINNYRNDDYANYVYRSEDHGESWIPITNGLPEERVARIIKEDPRAPHLLYLGTELGLFLSFDQGGNWIPFQNNLPTVAVNDLVVHPRDNDLVLGTHSRGIWIFDNLTPLQEASAESLEADAHLFSLAPATMIRYTRERGHAGDMIFYGENPPDGAIIDYHLREPVSAEDISLTVLHGDGTLIRELRPDTTEGVHRILWDFRYARLAGLPIDTINVEEGGTPPRRRPGPEGAQVLPGLYRVQLTVSGAVYERPVRVLPDPRETVELEERKAWQQSLFAITSLYEAVLSEYESVVPLQWHVEKLRADSISFNEDAAVAIEDVSELYEELLRRVRVLYGQVDGWIGPLTADQQAQETYFRDMLDQLASRKQAVLTGTLRQLNRGLPRSRQFTVD